MALNPPLMMTASGSRRRRFGRWALLCGLSLGIGSALAEVPVSTPPVTIAGYDYPPLFHRDTRRSEDAGTRTGGDDVPITGLLADVFRQLCHEQGLDCRLQAPSAARAYQQLEDGQIDILITGRIDRFKACCDTLDWTYFWEGGLYTRTPLDAPPTVETFRHRSLLIPLGLELPYKIFPGLADLGQQGLTDITTPATADQTLRMFAIGRGDFLWSSRETEALLRQHTPDPAPLYHFTPMTRIPIVGWVHRDNPRHDRLLERFNQALSRLRERGDIAPSGLLNDARTSAD